MVTRVERLSPAYERIQRLISDDVAVILDGGNATELGREHAGQLRDSDRGGIHAVEVSLTSSCRITGGVDVTNSTSEGGVRVYLREFTLHPFSANEYFVFPGGCVTYRFRFDADAEPTLALEAEQAVTFGLRTVLVHKIEQDLGLTLCGAGAAPCVAGD